MQTGDFGIGGEEPRNLGHTGVAVQRTVVGEGEVGPEGFRSLMGRFTTGVAVVATSTRDGEPVGLTVNSLTSVSLDPLLLLVSLDRLSATLGMIRERGGFAVSILPAEALDLALRVATDHPETRFEGVELRRSPGGHPVLPDALAWAECETWKEVEAGDHVLLLGRVTHGREGGEGDPLVFFRGRYGTFRR